MVELTSIKKNTLNFSSAVPIIKTHPTKLFKTKQNEKKTKTTNAFSN